MKPARRRLLMRLAPLGWFVGAAVVVIVSVLAMRQGADKRFAQQPEPELKAAVALAAEKPTQPAR